MQKTRRKKKMTRPVLSRRAICGRPQVVLCAYFFHITVLLTWLSKSVLLKSAHRTTQSFQPSLSSAIFMHQMSSRIVSDSSFVVCLFYMYTLPLDSSAKEVCRPIARLSPSILTTPRVPSNAVFFLL